MKRKNEAKWIESQNRWQIKVQSDGERRTFYSSIKGTKGKIEAESKADKWLKSKGETDPRFDAAWKEFLTEKQLTTGTANYNKLESLGRVWIQPEIKRRHLSSITMQNWQNCINRAGAAGRSKRTCGNIRGAITAFARFCKKNRWALEQPDMLTLPKNAPVGERTILQNTDLKTLFSDDTVIRYGKRQKAFYIYAWRFIVLLGLRRGELAGLMNTDLDGNILTIRRSVNSLGEITAGKTKNAQRRMMLPQAALDVLTDQRRLLSEHGLVTKWIFPAEHGGPMDTNALYKRWLTYSGQHGINSNLHELRHTFISTVKADLPEQLLKHIVGHSVNMDTYRVYAHELEGDRQRAADIVDGVFKKII